jgi:O-antigen ligase
LVVAPSIALLALLPSSLGYWRVGPEQFNLSLADVTLAAAFVAALPFVPWHHPRLRAAGRLLAVYLVILAVAVAVHPSQRTVLEWGHRGFLVGCGLAVGAALVARGLLTPAFRLFVVSSLVLAVAAIADTLGRSWEDGMPTPAYPFGFQKNPAALLIAMGVLVVVIAPRTVRLPRAVRPLVLAVQYLGIAACQSRGTAIALVIVFSLWLLRTGRVLRSPLVVVGIVAMTAMAYLSFNALFQSDQADSRFNSVNSRLDTYDYALDIWRDQPIAGAGLKFWRDPQYATGLGAGEPHNLVVSALGESGVVGIVGLGVLLIGASRLVAGRRDELLMLAGAVLWAKATASLFDIFWVAGTMTVPWVVIGAAITSRAIEHRDPASRSPVAAGSA